ncbi:MAG: hypothetical protein VCB63_16390, partial [Alphaproteobacteria bacterium]
SSALGGVGEQIIALLGQRLRLAAGLKARASYKSHIHIPDTPDTRRPTARASHPLCRMPSGRGLVIILQIAMGRGGYGHSPVHPGA